MSTERLSLQDQFDVIRKLIEHEDNLINIRTNWTLVFHGFLFAAFVSGVGLYEKLQSSNSCIDPIALGLLLVCFLGVVSGIAAYFGVHSAEQQLVTTTNWWKPKRDDAVTLGLPPIYIHSESAAPFGASVYFLVIAFVWAVLAALVIWSPVLITASGT